MSQNLLEKSHFAKAFEKIVASSSTTQDKMNLANLAAWCVSVKILSLKEVAKLFQVKLLFFTIVLELN